MAELSHIAMRVPELSSVELRNSFIHFRTAEVMCLMNTVLDSMDLDQWFSIRSSYMVSGDHLGCHTWGEVLLLKLNIPPFTE